MRYELYCLGAIRSGTGVICLFRAVIYSLCTSAPDLVCCFEFIWNESI